MKMSLIFLTSFLSFSAFAGTDFNCEGAAEGKTIEVNYLKGDLSYNDERTVDVSVSSETTVGRKLTVKGVSKNLVFAGGGTQTVQVEVNLKTGRGKLVISTKTFYRRSESSYLLTCYL